MYDDALPCFVTTFYYSETNRAAQWNFATPAASHARKMISHPFPSDVIGKGLKTTPE